MMTWSRPLTTYPARATRSKTLFWAILYRGDRHIASLTGSVK